MAFNLDIEFVGLCMFVPNSIPDLPKRMYVLLPAADDSHSAHGGVPHHLARLCFDVAYTASGSVAPEKVIAQVRMEGSDISLIFSQPLNPYLPANLVKLGGGTGERVDGTLLSASSLPGGLTARVTLGSGGLGTVPAGHQWRFNRVTRNFCHRLTWTIQDIEGTALELDLSREGDTSPTVVKLYPIDGRIAVAVYHVPAQELPPDKDVSVPPLEGAPAHHFAAYYSLFSTETTLPYELPRYVGPAPASRGGPGGRPYTCMMAQGDPEPVTTP